MPSPGHDPAAGGYGHLRASSADRERAADVLKAAFTDGRLSRGELEDRIGRVYQSRTYAELAALTADLPVGPLGTLAPHQQAGHMLAPQPPAYPAGPGRPPLNSLAVAALICALLPGVPAAGGLVAGVVARRQIRETGERGAGLATAAIVIGSIGIAVILLYLLLVLLH